MKNIKELSSDYDIKVENTPLYMGNEAKLYKVILDFKQDIDGILVSSTKNLLYRECIIGNQEDHNNEIKIIYDKLIEINIKNKSQNLFINMVPHFTDDKGNIFVEDINYTDFNIYDLLPDYYYINPSKKQKSKFKDFKNSVKKLNLNKSYIIPKIFEQLAILHANNFVIGEIKENGKIIKHPTLSLFLYGQQINKKECIEEIFIHDIHNLVELQNPNSFDYIKYCVSDLKDLSIDIVRFFKGIGIPQGGLGVYSKTLKKINPELYKIIYSSFLRDPKIEIDLNALEKSKSYSKKEQKKGEKVIKKLESKIDKKHLISALLSNQDVFLISKNRENIIKNLNYINPKDTEIIFDFDGTLTLPFSKNSLNIMFDENMSLNRDIDNIDFEGFYFRFGAISFLKLLLEKGYDVKIYSLGFIEVIYKLLSLFDVKIQKENIFGNNFLNVVYEKQSINIVFSKNKNQIVFGDNINDFKKNGNNKRNLKIGFLNENKDKKMDFNKSVDLYYIGKTSNFVNFYEFFRGV